MKPPSKKLNDLEMVEYGVFVRDYGKNFLWTVNAYWPYISNERERVVWDSKKITASCHFSPAVCIV